MFVYVLIHFDLCQSYENVASKQLNTSLDFCNEIFMEIKALGVLRTRAMFFKE